MVRPFDDEWFIKLSQSLAFSPFVRLHLLMMICEAFTAATSEICFEYFLALLFISWGFSIISRWLICFAFKVPKRRDIKHLSWQFSFFPHVFCASLIPFNRASRRRLLRFLQFHFSSYSFSVREQRLRLFGEIESSRLLIFQKLKFFMISNQS